MKKPAVRVVFHGHRALDQPTVLKHRSSAGACEVEDSRAVLPNNEAFPPFRSDNLLNLCDNSRRGENQGKSKQTTHDGLLVSSRKLQATSLP